MDKRTIEWERHHCPVFVGESSSVFTTGMILPSLPKVPHRHVVNRDFAVLVFQVGVDGREVRNVVDPYDGTVR